MFTPMQTPKRRAEFERAFHFLAEQMQQDKFKIPGGSESFIHSLRSVRLLPNGRIDFLSVDEQARLNANMSLNMVVGPISEVIREQSNLRTTNEGDSNPLTKETSIELKKKKSPGKKKAASKKRKEKKKKRKKKGKKK